MYPAGITSDWERLLPRFNIIPLSTIPSLSSVSAPPSLITPLAHPPYSLSLDLPPPPFSLSPSLCWNARPGIILSLSPSFAAAERTVKLHAFILFFPARPGTPIKVRQVKTRCVLYELGSAVSVCGEKCWGESGGGVDFCTFGMRCVRAGETPCCHVEVVGAMLSFAYLANINTEMLRGISRQRSWAVSTLQTPVSQRLSRP